MKESIRHFHSELTLGKASGGKKVRKEGPEPKTVCAVVQLGCKALTFWGGTRDCNVSPSL